jgi:hypothetical protein
MKSISDVITEARDEEVFYVIRFTSGINKGKYLASDGEFWTVSNYSVQYGCNEHNKRVLSTRNIKNAKSTLDEFNEWSKGSWGDAAIFEVSVSFKKA